ncbi:LuxR family transcriptional regulator [Streptomyces cellostaticus]|uniref:LuxR family transcriptional regulator n=1 Tax=Streptomyces cellostaticus TaxID=67285 RepID=A0A101NMH8_9ACTN|nr:LuxR C-terminal-related transcriptional regulator [Streptomyces cellostaticus]KUM95684.1 LuxR family transcriptional regulator [Streptomyces cellostaticus]GHI09716.1 LuxR family transcriptional regulator [Streptomyces cellostaticus]
MEDKTLTPVLSENDMTVYQWVLTYRTWDVDRATADLGLGRTAVGRSLRVLQNAGLVRVDPAEPSRVNALDPDLVASVLTRPLRESIQESQESLFQVERDFSRLRSYYLDAQAHGSDGVELIPTVEEVRAALDRASVSVSEEILTSQPGGNRVPEVLEEAWQRDTVLLARGVRMRTLYSHTARFNAPSQAYVARATALGAEYRTAHELFGRLIVFDKSLAFIPEHQDTWGAVVIREPSIVSYLRSVFEHTWAYAEPFSDAGAQGLKRIAKELDETILRLLASGLKDESIARRTGMSLRTTRKHIADIMQTLGADSRFQAGVLAAQAGLLPPSPEPTPTETKPREDA